MMKKIEKIKIESYSKKYDLNTAFTNQVEVAMKINEIIDVFYQDKEEKQLRAKLSKLLDMKFQLGERPWCVVCAKRIVKELKKPLKTLK